MNIFNNKFIATSLLLTVGLFSNTVLANTNSPYIDKKQQNQKQRIVNGVESGQLTGREAWRLGKQQGRIYHREQRLKSDGNFTARERAVIHRDLLRSSKSIYRQKHDGQVQGGNVGGLRSPGINKRQHNQKRRIGQGIRSGELTAGETARLAKQQASIHRQKRRFKADGTFTRSERLTVHKRQNRASKNIYRKKHNNRTR